MKKILPGGVVIGAIVNLVLNMVLIPLWGVIGAAIATSAALIIWNILLVYWVYKRTGLRTTAIG